MLLTSKAFNKLSLLAVKVHFKAFAFFIPSTSPVQTTAISSAYNSAIAFIEGVLDPEMNSSSLLYHCTNYILRTLISASCILLKVLNSHIAATLDTTQGKAMFNACILAVRSVSLKKNDFPDRVAEAHTRMWRVAGGEFDSRQTTPASADPLALVIRSRMCVSHVYDYVWSWRKQMSARHTCECVPRAKRMPFIDEPIIVADHPAPISASIAAAQDPSETEQDSNSFSENPYMLSQLEDFDFFNTLDWTFEENISSS